MICILYTVDILSNCSGGRSAWGGWSAKGERWGQGMGHDHHY